MDTNVLNHEKHERHKKKQNHEWTRMDTNIEVNHERHERHEKLRTTNGHEWIKPRKTRKTRKRAGGIEPLMDTNIEVNLERP